MDAVVAAFGLAFSKDRRRSATADGSVDAALNEGTRTIVDIRIVVSHHGKWLDIPMDGVVIQNTVYVLVKASPKTPPEFTASIIGWQWGKIVDTSPAKEHRGKHFRRVTAKQLRPIEALVNRC